MFIDIQEEIEYYQALLQDLLYIIRLFPEADNSGEEHRIKTLTSTLEKYKKDYPEYFL